MGRESWSARQEFLNIVYERASKDFQSNRAHTLGICIPLKRS